MTDTTPVYALPFLEDTDPPDIPQDGESSMLAVEAELVRVDTELAKMAGTGAPAWTAFTPTWGNLTVGNGVHASAYIKRGRLVVVRFKLTFGSTTVITGVPNASLPVVASPDCVLATAATAIYRDATPAGSHLGLMIMPTTAIVQWSVLGRTAANDTFTSISSTTPFTWATGDIIGGTIAYEANS